MESLELNAWSGLDQNWYQHKERNHEPFWMFMENFVTDNDVRSVVEIGGGMGNFADKVSEYTGVEVNQRAIEEGRKVRPHCEFIHADWVEVEPIKGKDLILAAAVIEHVQSPEAFIAKCAECEAQYVIIQLLYGANGRTVMHHRKAPNGARFKDTYLSSSKLVKMGHTLSTGKFAIGRLPLGRIRRKIGKRLMRDHVLIAWKDTQPTLREDFQYVA